MVVDFMSIIPRQTCRLCQTFLSRLITCPSKTLLYIPERAAKLKHLKIVLSDTLNCNGSISPCFQYREDGITQIREDLNLFLEEADTPIIPHTYYNILNGYKRIDVISNDTYVFALNLHYMSLFFDKGINELWLKFGNRSYTQILPMHIMHSNTGHEMCSMTLLLYVMTGCDVTNKIGTKYGALNAKPIDYLKNVWHEEAEKAEPYLVKVLRPSSVYNTMNELRIELYLDKSSSLIELPPTSSLIFGHILRSHFIIHQYLNLLNANEKSNVHEFGWIEAEDGCFIPDKCLSPIARYFTAKCGCKKGCCRRCQCLFADIKCTEFLCLQNSLQKCIKKQLKAMHFCKLKFIFFSKTLAFIFPRFFS